MAEEFAEWTGAIVLALVGWFALSAGLAGIVARGIRLRDAQEPIRDSR
ncbi:MAG: hypothetical protein QOC59_1366 [Microbacteriaceae bacterium]|nr:hypothetical protein [Microbacteriaceae bacterium]